MSDDGERPTGNGPSFLFIIHDGHSPSSLFNYSLMGNSPSSIELSHFGQGSIIAQKAHCFGFGRGSAPHHGLKIQRDRCCTALWGHKTQESFKVQVRYHMLLSQVFWPIRTSKICLPKNTSVLGVLVWPTCPSSNLTKLGSITVQIIPHKLVQLDFSNSLYYPFPCHGNAKIWFPWQQIRNQWPYQKSNSTSL